MTRRDEDAGTEAENSSGEWRGQSPVLECSVEAWVDQLTSSM